MLSPRIYWVESAISMVLRLKTPGLLTSGTKKTEKQRMKNQRVRSSQNLGNYLLRLQVEVSSQEDFIGMWVELTGPSDVHLA